MSLAAVYHTFKKKYQELKNLRSDSLIADSADLRQKLEGHRRIQKIGPDRSGSGGRDPRHGL
jgi:hypothetical protein